MTANEIQDLPLPQLLEELEDAYAEALIASNQELLQFLWKEIKAVRNKIANGESGDLKTV